MIEKNSIDSLHIVAFTHRNLSVNDIGKLHIEECNQKERLSFLKDKMGLKELMFLSTCNRVEFVLVTDKNVDIEFLNSYFHELYPSFNEAETNLFSAKGSVYSRIDAVEHLLSVASSVDSMIVGEREIISQVREAFESSHKMKLTGDLIRILLRHTIETAKKVYTQTGIAQKPVSVVSLAYHKLRALNIPLDARILIIGAGVTNTNMSRFLKKHGFTNFTVFNRTLKKAEKLAGTLNGSAHPLPMLKKFNKGFDIIITCTGSEDHIITPKIYRQLLQGDESKKVVIDIAIPQDLHPDIISSHKVIHISVNLLQQISNDNLLARSNEVQHVEEIISDAMKEFHHICQVRSVELAMREVPNTVKEIRATAMTEIFKDELSQMDEASLETIEKIVGYMEKKYMSIPMLMAKEILLKKQSL